MSHPLLLEDKEYGRYIDVIEGYIDDQSKLLSTATGRCINVCREFVQRKVDSHQIKDVVMRVLRRDKNGDRVKSTVGFIQYLKWVEKEGHILAPNMITYAHPSKRISYTSLFIRGNLSARSVIKKQGQRAEEKSETAETLEDKEALLAEAYFCSLEQGNKKFFNNSMSGAGGSEHNPLYYLTKHTTLTSTCRSCTSTANAINEKLIASNRHYYNLDVTLDAISYTLNAANLELIKNVIAKYNIRIPTCKEVKNLVFRSTSLYWRGDSKYNVIKKVIENMSDLERATFAYVGDLNAMCNHAGDFIRNLFDRLMSRSFPVNYTEEIIKTTHEDIIILSKMFCMDFMKGISPGDLKKKDPEKYQILVNTIGNVRHIFTEHEDFLRAFIITNVMPQNIFKVPYMIRRAVPASDTDSSIYTTQRIVKWYNGKIDWKPKSVNAGAIVSFLSSSMVAHGMLKLSTQIGVSEEERYRIAMKGEYFMSVLLVSNLTKHYAYLENACEGKIYVEPKMTNKGVQLKNSKLPKDITDKSFEWYEKIMLAITNNTPITPTTVMAYPAYLEHIVLENIESGNIDFLSKETVKPAKVYKNPQSSPALYADLWDNTFGRQYGLIEELPVTCKKVPVLLTKPKLLQEWIDSLEPALGDLFGKWVTDNNKDKFGHILLPQMNLPDGKLPREIIKVIDKRTLLSQITDHAYIFMTMLGIVVKNASYTRLCSDFITKEQAMEELKVIGLAAFDNW